MNLLLIPLAPLLAFGLLICAGRRLGKWSAVVAIAAMMISTWQAALAVRVVASGGQPAQQWAWVAIGPQALTLGLQADPLTCVMLSVVTIIGTLIQIYSVGYMAGDPRFSRFFAYLSLFCAAMLGLVLADNLLLLYMCWELVGLCSYLLISFWFDKPAAAEAGKKAFITTRIGDAGLLGGLLLLYWTSGTLQFAQLPVVAHQLSPWVVSGVALGIFAGAVGKSAQIPLHVWLPDAMEGPTPVSALIHAATMVAAGVYLVARTLPLFEAAPQVHAFVALIGTATAFFAATVACVMTDIKRVLAYSTMSQLGFMIAALGVGSSVASIFHLTTHAWFKALLFLGAGSVIHAAHTQDLREMGGLAKAMPITALTMGVAVWAISGIPPLSGFWSKDEILMAAWEGGHPVITTVLVMTGTLTAFYMMRLFTLTFLGTPRSHTHPHESPAVMTGPLVCLSLGAAGVGLLGSPWAHHWFHHWLTPAHGESAAPVMNLWLAGACTVAAVAAVAIAAARYVTLTPRLPAAWWRLWQPAHGVLTRTYGIDELYEAAVLSPLRGLWQWLSDVMDQRVIDRLVNTAGAGGLRLSRWKERFDRHVVDGFVNAVAYVTAWCGRQGGRVQTGMVQHYLLTVVLGAAGCVWWMLRANVR